MRAVFLVPVLIGLGLLVGSLALFRREHLDPRNFAIAILLSILVILSPVVYGVLGIVSDLFGFVYTFVFGFGLAILFLMALVVYLILSIGVLREETETMWQEIALMQTELRENPSDRGAEHRTED